MCKYASVAALRRAVILLAAIVGVTSLVRQALAAGTLTPVGGSSPIAIQDHRVKVLIDNGFARTEVEQTFHNAAASAVDAVYEFPVPPEAALSEMTLRVGDAVMRGEVLPKEQAGDAYRQQSAAGQSAGLATQNGFFTYQFDVAQIPPNGDATMTFVYYEKLELDTNVGRYLYPLQDGGTRAGAEAFWNGNDRVDGTFSFELELRSAFEVEEVRLTSAVAPNVERLAEGHYRVSLSTSPGSLSEDLVFYYRLTEGLPARVEVIPYRAEHSESGTFMMIVTPGTDLKKHEGGADYVYVLDVSGSMQTKLDTMVRAVSDSFQMFAEGDRFRVVLFDSTAVELTEGAVPATAENVADVVAKLQALQVGDSTNLFAGLQLGLASADPERVVNLMVLTDGVTNTGVIAPTEFQRLMTEQDVRLFGMLMGNSANWPLMDIITEASGGHYTDVSNADDIIGQVLLMRGKVEHETLFDARLGVEGAAVHDVSDFKFQKVHHGQQVLVLGRYAEPGKATMHLDAKVRGKSRSYQTEFELPALAPENPELERLWALEMIHALEQQLALGLLDRAEAEERIVALGVSYQLVTDYTSMLVVPDEVFDEEGIARDNLARTEAEAAAQAVRGSRPVVDYTVSGPSNSNSGPRGSSGSSWSGGGDGGAGALDPVLLLLGSLLTAAGLGVGRRLRGK